MVFSLKSRDNLQSLKIRHLKKMFFNVFLILFNFIDFWLRWVFVAVHGLFSSCGEQRLLLVAVGRLLIAMASLVAEHGL